MVATKITKKQILDNLSVLSNNITKARKVVIKTDLTNRQRQSAIKSTRQAIRLTRL